MSTNSTNTNTLEQMMKAFNGLPVVRQMIEEKKQATDEEESSARAECIRRLRSLRIEENNANSNRDTAVRELKAAEENLNALKASVVLAERSYLSASGARQAAEQSLIFTHGERHIISALNMLYRMRNECANRAKSIEHLRFTDHVVNGMIVSRRENPEFESLKNGVNAKLVAINEAIKKTSLLVESDAAPGNFRGLTSALLTEAGYVANVNPDELQGQTA